MESQDRAAVFRREIEAAGRAVGAARRRGEVVDQAIADGQLSREFAEEVYDVAAEESVDPSYALALVRSGFIVCELVEPEPAEETMQQDAPPWIAADAQTGDAVVRERRLRAGVRRLRAMLEQNESPVDAANAFLAEPDVAPGEY